MRTKQGVYDLKPERISSKLSTSCATGNAAPHSALAITEVDKTLLRSRRQYDDAAFQLNFADFMRGTIILKAMVPNGSLVDDLSRPGSFGHLISYIISGEIGELRVVTRFS